MKYLHTFIMHTDSRYKFAINEMQRLIEGDDWFVNRDVYYELDFRTLPATEDMEDVTTLALDTLHEQLVEVYGAYLQYK